MKHTGFLLLVNSVFCKFAYSLEFICDLQISTPGVLSRSYSDMGRTRKTLSQELTVFLQM